MTEVGGNAHVENENEDVEEGVDDDDVKEDQQAGYFEGGNSDER